MDPGEALQLRGSQSRARVEVFSADLENTDIRSKYLGFVDLFGVVLLRSCNHNFAIFDSKVLEPHLINSEGYVTLTGPNRSIPVDGEVLIFPWFMDVVTCCMDESQHVLWKADIDDMDRFIYRTIHCEFSFDLHVRFAVYRDPVEAHLDIYFLDLKCGEEEDAPFNVHGTVSASNSLLPDTKAKSFLFHRLSTESVNVKPGNSVPLPLSRRMVVIPHQSTLLVHASLQLCTARGERSTIDGTVKFNSSSDCDEGFIIVPDKNMKLLVKVSWVDCGDPL